MTEEEYPIRSHFTPKQNDQNIENNNNSIISVIKQILKPQTKIEYIRVSGPDFYPAYISERDSRIRAEKEVRELREEIYNLKVEHWGENDKLERRVYELEMENHRLKELVNSTMGQYL